MLHNVSRFEKHRSKPTTERPCSKAGTSVADATESPFRRLPSRAPWRCTQVRVREAQVHTRVRAHRYDEVSQTFQKQERSSLDQLRRVWGAPHASGLINRRIPLGSMGAVTRSPGGEAGSEAGSPCCPRLFTPTGVCKHGVPTPCSQSKPSAWGRLGVPCWFTLFSSEPT